MQKQVVLCTSHKVLLDQLKAILIDHVCTLHAVNKKTPTEPKWMVHNSTTHGVFMR
eukprot:m.40657 g.40657  ORF g.40657 m.40657 type:complete len:56 (+) comp14843_c0_seq2:168-335(+)